MLKKVVKRILISIPVLIGVVLAIFVMLRIVPGNPVTTMMGEHVNPAVIEKISKEMGLDQPYYIQFLKYIANALRGDFGTSYRLNRNVTQIIIEAFPNTVKLSLLAAAVSWLIGIVAGIVAAIRQNRLLDRLFMGCALMGVSMPVFMTALVLQYVFAFKLKWFPVSGFDSFRAMILPAIVLGWNSAGSIARMTRSNLVEIMQEDYIRTARCKGAAGICGDYFPCAEKCYAAGCNHDGAADFQYAVRRCADRECIRRSGNWTPGSQCH